MHDRQSGRDQNIHNWIHDNSENYTRQQYTEMTVKNNAVNFFVAKT